MTQKPNEPGPNEPGPNEPGLNLTGAVTFYESPVSLAHVEFRSNAAEDSLNVVRTEFVLSDVEFIGATSDALDADFCQGRISNCRFFDTGNDAIDVSGSTIDIARSGCSSSSRATVVRRSSYSASTENENA